MTEPPTHLKFGYQYMLEMSKIDAAMRAKGLTGAELHFACVRQYEDNHKDDPSYRERHARWLATASTPRPTDLLRQALEQIRDGHNDPRSLARAVLDATR